MTRRVHVLALTGLLMLNFCGQTRRVRADELSTAEPGADPGSWEVPFGGNAYLSGGDIGSGRRGRIRWDSPQSVVSFYFHIDRPAELQLSLRTRLPEGESRVSATVAGQSLTVEIVGGQDASVVLMVPLGSVQIEQAGYVQVDLQGIKRTGPVFADVSDLLVRSATPGLSLSCVRDNEASRFYWGRRGPSVHLGFRLPEGRDIEWFYSELTVPEGSDPIGSYFMANGFSEGYFGIQVNSSTERRILFSVWSPYRTDNPRDIPEDQRVIMLAKGDGVYTGEFGNEGSGGQSYLIYPWESGRTYCFLTRARPDGEESTVYTAWFRPDEASTWQLIASFRRPKTDTWLTRVHSFLENFSDRNGNLSREGLYGNQWVCDREGKWHSLTVARFTGDDIARRGYRLDFAGGVRGQAFFLRNGGFFNDQVRLDSRFSRPADSLKPPVIEFQQLDGYTFP